MSGYLWKYFYEDDVARFRALLESARYASRGGGAQKSYVGGQALGLGAGSAGSWDPKVQHELVSSSARPHDDLMAGSVPRGLVLTREDVNHRDEWGRTLLHLAASSKLDTALEFARALLDHPLTDIYVQDWENGWTALHRAFYEGNITIAISIVARDEQDLRDATAASFQLLGGLIKIKDNEGNAPFDVLQSTLLRPSLDQFVHNRAVKRCGRWHIQEAPWGERVPMRGTELFTFGNNNNFNLGIGHGDDRTIPERVVLHRPAHLIRSLAEGEPSSRWFNRTPVKAELLEDVSHLPFVDRNRPITIRSIAMGKYSTAVLTDDYVSNLYMCGHGAGGRLGLGDEQTVLRPTCVEGGALWWKFVSAVALGHHHTLAVTNSGELFSWGSNTFGQLGYTLAIKTSTGAGSSGAKTPTQLLPRQVFGQMRKARIIGIAASAIHSVAYNEFEVFTFGKNEGQLGIMDSDARSLQVQINPRRAGGIQFGHRILSVSAIDRATVCLLENREVYVYANYGYSKLNFTMGPPCDKFRTYGSSRFGGRYERTHSVDRIAAGGDTICVLTTSGKVLAVTVARATLPGRGPFSSTTNPSKIRGAFSEPKAMWANKKEHMEAKDVSVDHDGSIILVTKAGSVWQRVKRVSIKKTDPRSIKEKDYKFTRIPGLSSAVVGVCASGYGAYAAVQDSAQDCAQGNGLFTPLQQTSSKLEVTLAAMSPFQEWVRNEYPDFKRSFLQTEAELLEMRLSHSQDRHACLLCLQNSIRMEATSLMRPDAIIYTGSHPLELPVHTFLLAAASPILHRALAGPESAYPVSDEFSIRNENGMIKIELKDTHIYTIINLLMYVYYGRIARFWETGNSEWRRLRGEMLHVANLFKIKDLDKQVKGIGTYLETNTLERFFQIRPVDPGQLPGCDTIVKLADGQINVHAALMCRRSEFFNTLFKGRAGGIWVRDRQKMGQLVEVDLTHISSLAFNRALSWVYAEGNNPFAGIFAEDTEDYIDQVIEVLEVANELMMESLANSCQLEIRNYVTVHNASALLNSVAPCQDQSLATHCARFISLNLESVLQNSNLGDLVDDLLAKIDHETRAYQKSDSKFARRSRLEKRLLKRHPNLLTMREQERQEKIDSLTLRNKLSDATTKGASSFKAGSRLEQSETFHLADQRKRLLDPEARPIDDPTTTSVTNRKSSATDLMFRMDDEDDEPEPKPELESLMMGKTSFGQPDPMDSGVRPDKDKGKGRASSISNDGNEGNESSLKSPITAAKMVQYSGPWSATAPPSTPKLSMKDILEQASSSRTSNLSLELSQKSREKTPPSAKTKMSQKERKKIQHQFNDNELLRVQPSSTTPKPSPWKIVSASPNPKLTKSSTIQSPGKTAQHLTMRQTVANPSSSKGKGKEHTLMEFSSPPSQGRRPSGESVPAQLVTQASSSSQSPVQIKSIRHTPFPARPPLEEQHVSMTDILSQQQREKIIASGGGEKPSLSDIQAEQAFQEWWDKECARVQEEEQSTTRAESSNKGRGRERRRRRGEKQ